MVRQSHTDIERLLCTGFSSLPLLTALHSRCMRLGATGSLWYTYCAPLSHTRVHHRVPINSAWQILYPAGIEVVAALHCQHDDDTLRITHCTASITRSILVITLDFMNGASRTQL